MRKHKLYFSITVGSGSGTMCRLWILSFLGDKDKTSYIHIGRGQAFLLSSYFGPSFPSAGTGKLHRRHWRKKIERGSKGRLMCSWQLRGKGGALDTNITTAKTVGLFVYSLYADPQIIIPKQNTKSVLETLFSQRWWSDWNNACKIKI